MLTIILRMPQKIVLRKTLVTNILLDWFKRNEMKSNTDKWHFITVNNQDNEIGNNVITSGNSVKLLGVTIDNKLNFNKYVDNICKKANN